ncbi:MULTISPECIES: Lin1244/Lin1753 domain-containing protein [Olsenella]|uniref:Lin1244/Lin1753 domain-containing protein n=1 Tax=Olsenella TaxID=133925 RepID=UPI0007815885|nr:MULTISPECIES: Lin1244/Lin1753 domain-containing protein [Olsenella]
MCSEDPSSAPMAYFSHDANSAGDIKCRRLIRVLGYEGYERWWRVCELMASATGHCLPVSERIDAEILSDELRFDGTKALMSYLESLADFELISSDELSQGRVASEKMMRNAERFGQNRRNGRLGGRPKKE